MSFWCRFLITPGTHPYNPHTPELVQPSPHHGDKEINITLPSPDPRPIVQSNWRGRTRNGRSRNVFWQPCGLIELWGGREGPQHWHPFLFSPGAYAANFLIIPRSLSSTVGQRVSSNPFEKPRPQRLTHRCPWQQLFKTTPPATNRNNPNIHQQGNR